MTEPKTQMMGVWVDPLTSELVSCKKSIPATVDQMVTTLAKRVVTKVNNIYSLDPPLASEETTVQYYHPANIQPQDDIHTIGETDLVILIEPKENRDFSQKKSTILADAPNEPETSQAQGRVKTKPSQDDRIDELLGAVNHLRGEVTKEKEERKEELQVEKKERKEERAQLQAEMAKEKKERKEEKAQLQAEMAKEKKERKEEGARLQGQVKQLQEVEARLDGQVEQLQQEAEQLQAVDRQKSVELANERKLHMEDIKSIAQLTLRLMPLHLRVLLDLSRSRVLQLTRFNTWEELRRNRSMEQVVEVIVRELTGQNLEHGLSQSSVEFLCSYNNVRRDGNNTAHTAKH